MEPSIWNIGNTYRHASGLHLLDNTRHVFEIWERFFAESMRSERAIDNFMVIQHQRKSVKTKTHRHSTPSRGNNVFDKLSNNWFGRVKRHSRERNPVAFFGMANRRDKVGKV